jgi:MFS family permease
MYISGAMLLLAASRVFDLPTTENRRTINWRRTTQTIRPTLAWLLSNRAITAMMTLGIMAGTVNIVVQTLAPAYVQSVVGVDPADAIYVFAPSVVGLVMALVVAPMLMRIWGERLTSLLGFSIAAAAMVLLGLVGSIASTLDIVNPLGIADWIGFDLGLRLRTAAFLALPLGFGLSLTTTAIQTYINRRVPIAYQGRAFALQSSLKNGAAIVPLAILGGAAVLFGVDTVLVVAPFTLLLLSYVIVQFSFRFARLAPPSGLQVMQSFWTPSEALLEPDHPLTDDKST